MGSVYSLVYQPAPSQKVEPYHYNRVPTQQVTLIAGHGIEGDQKAGHHPDRQLNIMSYEAQQELGGEGFKAAPGELGEQIALHGLDVRTLSEGDRVQLGDTAVVEIVKPRTGCDWFEQIQGKPRTDAANRLGMMARVLEGGVVKVGDPVRVVETASSEA